MSKAHPEIGSKVTKGFLILFLRHSVGILLSIITFGLIIKYTTAQEYGSFILAQSMWSYVTCISNLGIDVFIIKENENIADSTISKIYFFHQISNLIFFSVTILVAYFVYINKNNLAFNLSAIVGVSFLIRSLTFIPIAKLEADLEYSPSGFAEITSQTIYATFIILAFLLGYGIYAFAIGMIISALCHCFIILTRYRIKPDYRFIDKKVFEAIKFGVSTQAVTWIWQFKDFAIPQIISHGTGTGFLGIYGLTNQFAQKLSFIRQIIWRLSLSATARMKQDTTKIRNAVQISSDMQSSLLAFLMVIIFVMIRSIETYGGSRWLGISIVYPAIALGMLANGIFSVGCAGLVSINKINILGKFHFIFVFFHILLFSFLLFTGCNPILSLYIAETSACIGYVYLKYHLNREFGPISIGQSIIIITISIGLMIAAAKQSILVSTMLSLINIVFIIMQNNFKTSLGIILNAKNSLKDRTCP